MKLKILKKLQSSLEQDKVFFFSNPFHLYYLTGIKPLAEGERETYLLLSKKQIFLFHSPFISYKKNIEITCIDNLRLQSITDTLNKLAKQKVTTCLYDPQSTLVSEQKALGKLARESRIELRESIWQFRTIKSSTELKRIQRAINITKKAISEVITELKEGQTELEVKNKLIIKFYELGAEAEAFPTIVAFGQHSAKPHHQPGKKKLSKNTPVLIDCGAKYEGYCSDMTRTIWFGDKPSEEFVKIEKVVKKAYKAANQFLGRRQEAEVSAAELDNAAREIISQAGYGQYFIHTTGHGLGLEIHEPPSLNAANKQAIKSRMVITIEPGIYLPKKFGYRHEDTIFC